MSGLQIRSGGAIEVDSASLRAAAGRLRAVSSDAADEAAALRRLSDRAREGAGPVALTLTWAGQVLDQAAERAAELAGKLEHAAGLYETVELLAARDLARAAGDEEAAARADRRLAALWRTQPLAVADGLAAVHRPHGPSDLERQTWMASSALGMWGLSVFATLLWSAQAAIGMAGRGTVAAGTRLRGAAAPVAVASVSATAVAPPASLADAASRIPGAGESRVRVERYTLPGGAVQFAVYIAGTQSGGPGEAFDMASNLELYDGRASASYEAVRQALRDAGADPGATVHVFGHSQGAMIGERLTLDGEYDAATLVSFGSPVQAEVGGDTLAVSVRHTDDPVASLQGGGHPGTVGAPGSFVVEREADPDAGLRDLRLPAHHLSAYAETARQVDASQDPRARGLQAVFRDLSRAETATATEYAVARISPRVADAG